MNSLKGLGIVLVVAGALALVYGATHEAHKTELGPISSIKDKGRSVPVWVASEPSWRAHPLFQREE
jgi:hypothetical protein